MVKGRDLLLAQLMSVTNVSLTCLIAPKWSTTAAKTLKVGEPKRATTIR